MKYWSVAAGSTGRDYSQDFLDFGMAFVGGAKQVETMLQVQLGDRIILKSGMTKILAVGTVVECNGKCVGNDDKEWLHDFDGWDLSAYCYVQWHVPPNPVITEGLTRTTIQRVHQNHLIALTDKLMDLPCIPVNKQEPETDNPSLEDDQILNFLIREGLRPASAVDLTAAFHRIRLLAKYYYDYCKWEDIREHETRTFLIVPLLLALGWAEQQIKIELASSDGGRIDLACFSKPFRRDENKKANLEDCKLIIESKGFSSGLDYAKDQAFAYAKNFPTCQVVVVSNGYCYKIFRREGDRFQTKPYAYLNLLRPKQRYPIDPSNVDGGLEVFKQLLP